MLDAKRLVSAGALTAIALAAVGGGAVQASEGPPKLTARPHKVMVDATVTLKGRGFPANTTITLRECGLTFWLAPKDPCLESGASVSTGPKGEFQTSFRVGLCPEGEPTSKPTQRVCYVGELVTGEDNGSLLGAARLIVTYP